MAESRKEACAAMQKGKDLNKRSAKMANQQRFAPATHDTGGKGNLPALGIPGM
jgi:hypothetical protein